MDHAGRPCCLTGSQAGGLGETDGRTRFAGQTGITGWVRLTGMARNVAAILVALALSGCTGPFFYRDVIVPTYRQVDPNAEKPVQPPAPP